jgi:hypothetical protein
MLIEAAHGVRLPSELLLQLGGGNSFRSLKSKSRKAYHAGAGYRRKTDRSGDSDMSHKMIAFAAVAVFCCLFVNTKSRAQQYTVLGSPIKKAWGAIRGNYQNSKGELRLIFEDQLGTVRFVSVDPDVGTANVIREMRRE